MKTYEENQDEQHMWKIMLYGQMGGDTYEKSWRKNKRKTYEDTNQENHTVRQITGNIQEEDMGKYLSL